MAQKKSLLQFFGHFIRQFTQFVFLFSTNLLRFSKMLSTILPGILKFLSTNLPWPPPNPGSIDLIIFWNLRGSGCRHPSPTIPPSLLPHAPCLSLSPPLPLPAPSMSFTALSHPLWIACLVRQVSTKPADFFSAGLAFTLAQPLSKIQPSWSEWKHLLWSTSLISLWSWVSRWISGDNFLSYPRPHPHPQPHLQILRRNASSFRRPAENIHVSM